MDQRESNPWETATGGSLRAPGDPDGIPLLTDRERQTLFLVGTGAGNRLIARRLGISERTVRAHLSNAVRKIGVRSRVEAAVFAYAYLTLPDHPDHPAPPVVADAAR
ncbi:response regulator transcription factor [Streptomyces sp. MAR4 CNX-425]|uniref:response regulator transcription factor n=1 Tax=Streptomyces sp. MAR4 CNX-425 TaxID=3406343 RepID=UPI003B513EB8